MSGETTFERRPDTALVRVHSLDGLHDHANTWPVVPGQASGRQPSVLCLRPLEWLMVDQPLAAASRLADHARKAIDPDRATVLDVSDALSLTRLRGPAAAWLLNKLAGLDFLAGSGNEQHCAQTRMGDAAVLVHHHRANGVDWVFDLLVDASLAKYLDRLLNASLAHACELAHQFGDFR